MAQPFPPQGGQKQYNERPLKVYGEQYLSGQPVPIHVVIGPGDPPDFTEAARVALPRGVVVVSLTDWVVSSRYSGQPTDVLSAEEFSERFGGGQDDVPIITTEEDRP
jgi:hypothetical protein